MRNFRDCSRLIYLINTRSVHCLSQIRYVSDICKFSTFKTTGTFWFQINNTSIIREARQFSCSHGLYSKDKGRGGKKKSGPTKIDLREIEQYLDVDKISLQMENTLEHMKNNFIKSLTLRSNAGSIEDIKVTFENKEYFLQELAQVARRQNSVILDVHMFPQSIPQILIALTKSKMNLNPQQDGTKIAVPIPKVTREHREILSKNARAFFVKCRDSLKNIQNNQLKELKNKPEVSEDSFHRMKSQLEVLCNQYVKRAEDMLKAKQNELTGS